MSVSRGNNRRVRIMLDNDEPGRVQPQSSGFMEPGSTSTGIVSQSPGHCRKKPLPKMSQEMINVMSSFNMIDISTSYAPLRGSNSHGGAEAERIGSEGRGFCAVQKNSWVKGKTFRTMKAYGMKPTHNKLGKVPHSVKLPPMNAGAQKYSHPYEMDNKDLMAPLTATHSCSPATKRLLARSSAVFGHIDNVRENAKLACSTFRRSSEGKLDLVASRVVVDSNKNYYSTTEDYDLGRNTFRSNAWRPEKQRSLEESANDAEEEQSWHGFSTRPFGKTRSATIS